MNTISSQASQDEPQRPDRVEGCEAPAVGAEGLLKRRLGLLDQADLGSLLGVDVRTLSTWRTRGEGPAFVKVGNRVLYREEDVTRWLAGRVEETPESKFGS
jgi:hypothetical protein